MLGIGEKINVCYHSKEKIKKVAILCDDYLLLGECLEMMEAVFKDTESLNKTFDGIEFGIGDSTLPVYCINVFGEVIRFQFSQIVYDPNSSENSLIIALTESDFVIAPFGITTLEHYDYDDIPLMLNHYLSAILKSSKSFIIPIWHIERLLNKNLDDHKEWNEVSNYFLARLCGQDYSDCALINRKGEIILKAFGGAFYQHFPRNTEVVIHYVNLLKVGTEISPTLFGYDDFIQNFILQLLRTDKRNNYNFLPKDSYYAN